MKQQKSKKCSAFTLVELLVVIAILAILATVTIVGYTQFIKKANVSVDEAAVRQMNIALEAAEITDGTPVNPKDAMQLIEADGMNAKDYTPLESKNSFYWDKSTNRVLIYQQGENNTGSVIYPADLAEKYGSTVPSNNVPKYWYTLQEAYDIVTEFKEYNGNTISWNKNGTTVLSTDTEVEVLQKTLASLESTDTFQLQGDLEVKCYYNGFFNFGKEVAIDLGEHTLNFSYAKGYTISTAGTQIIFRNGTLIGKSSNYYSNVFSNEANTSITFENVNFECSTGTPLYPKGTAAQVNVISSKIIATNTAYGISTNAQNLKNGGVRIDIKDSTVMASASDGWTAVGILINVEGNLNIENSIIAGECHAVAVRAGTATIKDSIILRPYVVKNDATEETYINEWKDGNSMPFATLLIGNQQGNYPWDASCDLQNTKVYAKCSVGYAISIDEKIAEVEGLISQIQAGTYSEKGYDATGFTSATLTDIDGQNIGSNPTAAGGKIIYMGGNSSYQAYLTYDDDCVFGNILTQNNDYVYINGKTATELVANDD